MYQYIINIEAHYCQEVCNKKVIVKVGVHFAEGCVWSGMN